MRSSRRQALLAGLLLPLDAGRAYGDDLDLAARARWLAGIAPIDSIEPSAEWMTYAAAENERWKAAEPRLRAIRAWSTRELLPLLPKGHAVFYPFAGPDALHALAFFGAAKRMVLVGLEPVGTLPVPSPPPPPGFFERLGNALADVHRLTFFRTREMSTDFHRAGVLSGLVATIARMGGKVSSVQVTQAPPGARIDWRTPEGEARRLDYIQADLANAAVAADRTTLAKVQALAPFVTFVKAAMYLLFEPRFSALRQVILDDSSVILQDDTGVPFKHFDARWGFRFFGRYEAPVTPFEARVQMDLQDAFLRRSPSALPFGVGYHVQPQRSNLLVASKGLR